MLSEILSKKDCSSCRFCCSFRRCSIWETPIFTNENIDAIKVMAAKTSSEINSEALNLFTESGQTYARYDLSNCYQTNDSEEEAPCPYLNPDKGCILDDVQKPWDCKIWPLRVAKKADGEIVIALTPTCPSINKLDLEAVRSYVNDNLRDSLLTYAINHPYLIKDYKEDFFIEL